MRASELAPPRAPREVAVFDVGDGHLDRARAEVQPEQGLRAHHAAPLDELVGAELIRLERIPGTIEHHRTLRLRADPLEPVVAGDEIAARITNDRYAEVLDLARDVGAESVDVGQRRARLLYPGVDGPPEMLEEGAKDPSIELSASARLLDQRTRRTATALRVSNRVQPRGTGEHGARPAQTGEKPTTARRSHWRLSSPFRTRTSRRAAARALAIASC